MGLAVVHCIVENNKRTVLVDSETEKGTMVTVYFPSVDEDTIPEAAFYKYVPPRFLGSRRGKP